MYSILHSEYVDLCVYLCKHKLMWVLYRLLIRSINIYHKVSFNTRVSTGIWGVKISIHWKFERADDTSLSREIDEGLGSALWVIFLCNRNADP